MTGRPPPLTPSRLALTAFRSLQFKSSSHASTLSPTTLPAFLKLFMDSGAIGQEGVTVFPPLLVLPVP